MMDELRHQLEATQETLAAETSHRERCELEIAKLGKKVEAGAVERKDQKAEIDL